MDDVSLNRKMNLKINPLYLIKPCQLEYCFDDQNLGMVNMNSFLSEYKSSDLSCITYLEGFMPTIKEIQGLKKSQFIEKNTIFSIIVRKRFLEMVDFTLKKLISDLKSKGYLIDDKNFSIKNFDSFSSAIFSIFISVSSKLPTLASH